MKIAITGSIASGKTQVSNYIKNKGYQVIDLDEISHYIYLPNTPCYNKVISEFGTIILVDGVIDRKVLSKIVFNDQTKLSKLNEIVHPYIIDEMKRLMETKKTCFVVVPLLYECSLQNLFDKVIVVSCSLDTQISRLVQRNNITPTEAKKLISTQMSNEEKIKLCDYVIENENDLVDTYQQIDKILEVI